MKSEQQHFHLPHRDAAIQWARELTACLDVLYLDTETTGLGDGAGIIEIAVIDPAGEAVLDTLALEEVEAVRAQSS